MAIYCPICDLHFDDDDVEYPECGYYPYPEYDNDAEDIDGYSPGDYIDGDREAEHRAKQRAATYLYGFDRE